MANSFRVEILQGGASALVESLSQPLELGRQRHPGEPMFVKQVDAAGARIALAKVTETRISRAHVRLEPAGAGLVRVTNQSDKNPVQIDNAVDLQSFASREIAPPFTLLLGDRSIFIGPVDESGSASGFHSLAAPTAVPLSFSHSRPETTFARPVRFTDSEAERIAQWMQVVVAVLHSAATSTEFFEQAAQGIVDLIGFDHGATLLFEPGQWNVASLRSRTARSGAETSWRPSRHVLDRMLNEKRTFWHTPSHQPGLAASLVDVQAVVASPILNAQGNVIGALYADRRRDAGTLSVPHISKAEAMLLATLASGVAMGLARIEHQQAALAAQVRFEQFFSSELSRQLSLEPDLLDGRDAEVTVLFADIRGFSRVSEHLGPARTVAWIQSVLTALSDCVLAHQGVLVDYIGDELMAMWGAPTQQPNHADLACAAAADMLRVIPSIDDEWRPQLGAPTEVGIGVNTGIARVGNMGTERKFKYGPLGNTVNLASRVQGATKYLKTSLLITGATRARLTRPFCGRRLCNARVVNISEPVQLYALHAPDDPRSAAFCTQYEAALDEFEAGRCTAAATRLADLLKENPADGPAMVLLSRAVNRLANEAEPFRAEWDLPGK